MAKGKLLPKKPVRREVKQQVVFSDPISKKKVEITFSIVADGDHIGCPIIEVNKRLVLFELRELAYAAVLLFRESGVLPKGTPEEQEAERERIAGEADTGFSSVAPKEKKS